MSIRLQSKDGEIQRRQPPYCLSLRLLTLHQSQLRLPKSTLLQSKEAISYLWVVLQLVLVTMSSIFLLIRLTGLFLLLLILHTNQTKLKLGKSWIHIVKIALSLWSCILDYLRLARSTSTLLDLQVDPRISLTLIIPLSENTILLSSTILFHTSFWELLNLLPNSTWQSTIFQFFAVIAHIHLIKHCYYKSPLLN